jgi:hypothetical protein
MIGATKLPNSSYASSIDEAQTLIRRCAEPRPAADSVKAANRADLERASVVLLKNLVPLAKAVRLLGVSLSSLQDEDESEVSQLTFSL